MDSKILETRLILKESSFVGSSVSKCASKLQSLVNAKTTQDLIPFDSFIREMLQYKLDVTKVEHIQYSHDRQIEAYNAMEQDINEKIKEIEETIFELETQFKNTKSIRLHREQLEKKATVVHSLPSQSQLKRKLDQLDASVHETEASLTAMNSRIAIRYNQFGSLLKCIGDLQSKLVEESEGIDESEMVDGAGADDDGDEEVRERDDNERHEDIVENVKKPDNEVEEENEPQNEIIESFDEEPSNN